MRKAIVFEGILAILVSLGFLLMTLVEIPFYVQEVEVQKVALVALGGSVLLLIFGVLHGGREDPVPRRASSG